VIPLPANKFPVGPCAFRCHCVRIPGIRSDAFSTCLCEVDWIERGDMLHSNRNFIVAYVLLVGLPVVGLAGVLKRGRSITAPISIDGTWTLQADPGSLAALACGKSPALSDLAMAISQSGGSLTLTLGNGTKSPASGVLVGRTLKASILPSWSDDAECSGRELSLVANVDPTSNPRSLSGTISLSDCTACQPVEFRARRTPPAAQGGH
jgi:hypothetical protein